MTPEMGELFREAEMRAERTLGALRVAAALILGAAFAIAVIGAEPSHEVVSWRQIAVALTVMGAYLTLGVTAFLLATPRRFRSWMPWLLVTCDVAFVAAGVAISLVNTGLPGGHAFVMPSIWLVPVVLAFGALRYDPRLQAYVVALVLGALALAAGAGSGAGRAATVPPFLLESPPNVMRLVMVSLAGAVLVLAAARARALLRTALDEAQRRANLTRYLPQEIAEWLALTSVEEARRGRRQPVGVLFVDIRGFTALAEAMPADALGELVTEFRRTVATTAARHGGVIDKFIGDAAMVLFGVPTVRADDARRAVDAACALQQALAELARERARAGREPFAVGIGVHYGEAFCGAVGDSTRLEYTVLGDTVNVAARLEQIAKEEGEGLLASGALLAAAGEDLGRWRALPPRALRGRDAKLALYALPPASA
jgi:adenylate cyclase